MAPTARTSLSLPEYSKRERKAILLLTLGFIILSALVHMGLGAMYRPTRPVADIAPQPHESTVIGHLESPTPMPTPPPTPRPYRERSRVRRRRSATNPTRQSRLTLLT